MVTKQRLMFCSLGRGLLSATVLALSVSASALWAATINVPGDFPSIQAAHDAAISGDTVLVAPGTYVGQITITKAITVASHFLTTGDEGYIGATILDGGGGSYVIRIPADAQDRPTIQGFTIQNGEDGIVPNAMFNLLDCVVRDTSDGVDYEDGSGGLVQFCTFELNSDDGIDLDNDVEIVIADSLIRDNNDDGIEIRMQGYSGPTLDIIITRNEIHGNGEDGIQLIHYDVLTDRFFEITDNFIYDNVDAGIGMMDGSTTQEDFRAASIPEPIYIFNNTFANNSHGITGGDNTVVLNNIFVDHPVIAVKNVDADSELAFNLFFNNGTDNSGSNVDVGSSVFADPFLTATLELPPGSPAIDAGTAFYVWQGMTVLDLPSSAFSGAAPDMGAFEFDSGGVPEPDPPVLEAPPDGALNVSLTPTLGWNGDGDNFTVHVATDEAFDNLVDTALVSTTQYTVAVGALEHLMTYFWRVNASNAGGTSDFSFTRSFMTEAVSAPPNPPILLSPSDGAVDVPLEAILEWNGTAEDFEVEVASDAGFVDVVFSPGTVATTIGLPAGTLLHATEYYWRVRGNNALGPGDFSAAFQFTTVAAPDTIPPNQPEDLSSPAQTGSTIDLLWDASTDNVGVSFYNIYRDGVVVASESSTNHTAVGLTPGTSYDFQVSAVDAAGNESPLSVVLTISTLALSDPVTLSIPVVTGSDDAEERVSSGSVGLGSSDLELTTDGSNQQEVGIRFQNVTIPPAAVIEQAYIQFTVDEAKSDATTVMVFGQAADNPLGFVSSDGNVSSRAKTLQAVAWSPSPWNLVGAAGVDQRTPELRLVVQEIVDRAGWAEGNAMVFMITGTGVRTADSYDGDSTTAPVLHITYAVPVGPPPPDPPTLLLPPDGATDVSIEPTLSWDGTADTFTVEVSSLLDFSVVEFSASDITATSIPVPPGALAFETIYYWRVCGTNSGGTGPFSMIYSFTTEMSTEPPPPPALISPPDGAMDVTLEPLLDWSGAGDNFNVEVASDPSFGALVFETTTDQTMTPVSAGKLEYDTDYFWRVQGVNTFGIGSFSAPFLFHTLPVPDTEPPSPPQDLSSPSQTGTTISLTWSASTDNVGVDLYNIYRDDVKVAGVGSASFTDGDLMPGTSYTYEVSAKDAAGNESSLSDPLTVMTQSVSDPVTISVQVSAGDDDAEERLSSGSVGLTSSDLELVQDGSRLQAVGIRLQNVAVPKGATIQEAYIQFTVDEAKSDVTSLEIRGQASDQPAPFTSTLNNITIRPTTAQAVSWSPPPWNSVGAAGLDQRTPDLKAVVQEIVDRIGWTEGNAMAFVITGTGVRTAESFNGVASAAPVLTVTYVVSIGPVPPDPPVLLSPPDGANDVSLTPDLSWDGVADTFDFQVAADPLFDVIVASETVVTTGVTLTSGILANGTTYHWRVRGTDSVGTGAFSAPFSFTTISAPDDEPPSQPQNLNSPSQTGTTIDLTWDGSTDNVGVVQYNVYRDDSLVGSVGGTSFTDSGLSLATSYGYQVSAEDAAGNESARSDSLTVMTQSGSDPVTISVQVSAREDDAEERLSNGSVNLGSSDLELVQDGSKLQAVGIRFRNVAVPQGAVIEDAHIQFTVDETDSGATSLQIRGQAEDNPGAFVRSAGNVTNRPTTDLVVDWTPSVWNTKGASGLDQRTPDLSVVVQKIIDRGGWTDGNAIVFIVTGSGERTAESFDGDASAAPILTITWRP
jgi:chitodextrinase